MSEPAPNQLNPLNIRMVLASSGVLDRRPEQQKVIDVGVVIPAAGIQACDELMAAAGSMIVSRLDVLTKFTLPYIRSLVRTR